MWGLLAHEILSVWYSVYTSLYSYTGLTVRTTVTQEGGRSDFVVGGVHEESIRSFSIYKEKWPEFEPLPD